MGQLLSCTRSGSRSDAELEVGGSASLQQKRPAWSSFRLMVAEPNLPQVSEALGDGWCEAARPWMRIAAGWALHSGNGTSNPIGAVV